MNHIPIFGLFTEQTKPGPELIKETCNKIISSSIPLKPEDLDFESPFNWGYMVGADGFFSRVRCKEILKARIVKPEPKYQTGDKLYYTWNYDDSFARWDLSESKGCASCENFSSYIIRHFIVTEIEYDDGFYIYSHTEPGYENRPDRNPIIPEWLCFSSVKELEMANPINIPEAYFYPDNNRGSWENARPLFLQLREFIKQINWREHYRHFGSEFYDPETNDRLSTNYHGWSLWLNGKSHDIKTVEDFNYRLGSLIKLGPPEVIKRIRRAYEKEGFLVIGKPNIAFKNLDGVCWNFSYVCPVCKKSQITGGGLQGHGKNGMEVPWFFMGGISCGHDKCKMITSDCFISEEAYKEYKKFYNEP